MDIQDSVWDQDRVIRLSFNWLLGSYFYEISHKSTPGITTSLKCLEDEIQIRWPLHGVIILK